MHRKFSADIEALLQLLSERPLTLQDIIKETADRGFSIVIFLLTIPFLFPMPPGLAGVVAPGCILLAIQMALGRKKPWLPQRIARFRFPKKIILHLLANLKKITRFFEKITRPRWLFIARNPLILRINGVLIAWLTILLSLPIPGTNPFPTIGILLLTVSMLEMDGLLMCIAYGWSISTTIGFVLIGYGFLQASELIFQ
jgi:hypothetical protein